MSRVEFTYSAYKNLIHLLQTGGYRVCSYHNWQDTARCVILRHDIDSSLGQAMALARVERELARRAAEDPDIKDAGLALELLRKKYYNRLQTEEDRRKTQAALARRGFGGGDIRRAMDAFREEMGGWADNGGMEPEIGEITKEWP